MGMAVLPRFNSGINLTNLTNNVSSTNFTYLANNQSIIFNLTGYNNTSISTTPAPKYSCLEQAESYTLVIPIAYTLIFLGVLAACSILYFLKLKHHKTIYVKENSMKSNIIEYFKILYKFRSAYGAILTSLFDQISDISVINQLYLLSNDEKNNKIECFDMNVTYLFYASIFFFVFYRIISSIAIFIYSRHSLYLTILQLFDLTFIKTLEINYKFQKIIPCSPQRYILNLEAMFEAYPQFILQVYFLVSIYLKDNATENINIVESNPVLITSIFFSLLSITSKKLSQDCHLVQPEWQKLNFHFKSFVHSLKYNCKKWCVRSRDSIQRRYTKDAMRRQFEKEREDLHLPEKWINTRYINRVLWRIVNVSSRMCLWFLIWRIIGGSWLLGFLSFEFLFYACVCYLTKQVIYFEGFMGFIIQHIELHQSKDEHPDYDDIAKRLFWYDIISWICLIGFSLVLFIVALTSNNYNSGVINNLSYWQSFMAVWIVTSSLFCCYCFLGIFVLLSDDCVLGLKYYIYITFFGWIIRLFVYFLLNIAFINYYIALWLVGIDLLVIIILSQWHESCIWSLNSFAIYFVHRYVSVDFDSNVLFGFQQCYSLNYYLFVVMYCFFGNSIYTSFTNDYNTTISNLLNNSPIVQSLLIYVGVCVVIVPIWTFKLLYIDQMVNEQVKDDRTLEQLSESGDIFGVMEMSSFGDKVADSEMRGYARRIVNTANFANSVFPNLYVLLFL